MLQRISTPHICRQVWLREETSDSTVWGEVFTGRYHVPPDSMPEPGTVLDLGSNIGLTLADYRYRWPRARIVGIELDADNVALARRNAPGAIVRQAAVAAEAGSVHYWKAGAPFAYKLDPEGETVVPARALEEIIRTEFDVPVDFLKMDVEGTEWELFQAGASWAYLVRHLLVELHYGPSPEESISRAISMLEELGFEAVKHERHPVAVWAVR